MSIFELIIKIIWMVIGLYMCIVLTVHLRRQGRALKDMEDRDKKKEEK